MYKYKNSIWQIEGSKLGALGLYLDYDEHNNLNESIKSIEWNHDGLRLNKFANLLITITMQIIKTHTF